MLWGCGASFSGAWAEPVHGRQHVRWHGERDVRVCQVWKRVERAVDLDDVFDLHACRWWCFDVVDRYDDQVDGRQRFERDVDDHDDGDAFRWFFDDDDVDLRDRHQGLYGCD